MKRWRKKGAAWLLAALTAISLTACSSTDSPVTTGAGETTEAVKTTGAEATAAEKTTEENKTVTVVDQAGRTVTVGEVDSIALCWYMANDFVLSLRAGDRIAAIGPYDDFQLLVEPALSGLDTVGRGRPDMEKMAALNPDLFIHTASDGDNLQACDELGIPAVAIAPETAEETLDALKLVGKALGQEERAQMLCDYYNEIMDIAAKKTADLKEADKPTFLLLGKDMGAVATNEMMQAQMILAGGGINMAGDMESEELWPVAGTEQIFAWDPDYLFISSTANFTAEDIRKDAAWADLTAVKEGHVYEVPSELHSWENLGLAPCLGTVWSMMKMHPDLYTEEDFDKLVKEFYKTVYDLDIDREILKY
jgi:iron complex transport system substrate-binding protein